MQPLNVVEGEPNMSKSKGRFFSLLNLKVLNICFVDALIALHASSDISQFYSVGVRIMFCDYIYGTLKCNFEKRRNLVYFLVLSFPHP